MNQEVKITVLKAVRQPKPLTARAPASSLQEHRLAFLAANNKSGFALDELGSDVQKADSLFDVFFLVRSVQTLDKPFIDLLIKRIKRILNSNSLDCGRNDARTIIYRTLGFPSKKAFDAACVKKNYQEFWVNPKYMAPMSDFNLEKEIVRSDPNTEAFLGRINDGFKKSGERAFYPDLPWKQVLSIIELLLEHQGKVSQQKVRNVSRVITQKSKNVIHHSEALTILARLLGYETWPKAFNSTAGGFIKCRRYPHFYTKLLDEFGHLNMKNQDKENDSKENC